MFSGGGALILEPDASTSTFTWGQYYVLSESVYDGEYFHMIKITKQKPKRPSFFFFYIFKDKLLSRGREFHTMDLRHAFNLPF